MRRTLFATVAAVVAIALAVVTVPARLEAPAHAESLLFFDGVCNLCDGFVSFVADNDSRERVKFGAIQRHGDLMASLGAGRYAEGGEEALSTLVLIQDGSIYTRSDAALRTMALLDAPVNAVAAFHVLPRPVRDWGYRLVARYRYLIFGQTETCRPPTPRFQRRFLDYDPRREHESDVPAWARS